MGSFEDFLRKLKQTGKNQDEELNEGDVITRAPVPSDITHPDWLLTDKKTIDKLQSDITGRYIPVRIYSSNDSFERFRLLADRVNIFLKDTGIVVEAADKPKRGSWFQNTVARFLNFLNREETQARIRKAEKALEIQLLKKHEIDLDLQQAGTARLLLESISKENSAVIQIGRLLIVKSDRGGANIIVKSLTDKELEILDSDPSILSNPNELFNALVSCPSRHVGKIETALEKHEEMLERFERHQEMLEKFEWHRKMNE